MPATAEGIDVSTFRTRLPPFSALLAFRAAATHDRMAKAAESLGVTESAVSHQVRQLENFLQAKLFDRSGGRLTLTVTGQRYLDRIDPAIREIHAATEAVLPRSDRATVRLTLPPSLAATWLIPMLSGLEQANPDLDLQLIPTTRVVDLRRDHVDLAIRHGKGRWDGVEAVFLFEDLATPVCAPGFLVDGAVEPTSELLARSRLIVNRSIPHEWEEWARARGLLPPNIDGALVLDTIEQVLQVAESGHGLAIGRRPYLDERLATGKLVAPFGAAGPTGAAYYLCRPAGLDPTAAAAGVSRWLQAAAERWQSAAAAVPSVSA
ncbi:MAG: LysR family transcriptional regulator [Defluviicoccus sp.]|nr:MAG: LysR family transcriptional regulator [Defluviicoccus sp.]